MRFVSVKLHNFLSYGSPEQELLLDKRGLLAVTGENKSSHGADSNGAGKSSILEAIVWGLYGLTMRGYKGDEVINRNAGADCFVELQVEDEEHRYVVRRTRASGGRRKADLLLEIDGSDATQGTIADTQALVQTIVGMDFKTFTQSVMMWHGTKPFSRMSDGEQKAVLEDILRLDQLSKACHLVKDRVVDRQQTLTRTTDQLMAVDDRISEAEKSKRHLLKQSLEFSEIKAQKRKELSTKKLDIQVKIEKVHHETGLDKLLQNREDLRRKEEELGERRRYVQNEKLRVTRSFAEKRTALSKREGTVQGKLSQIQKTGQDIIRHAGSRCPECHQYVDPESADKLARSLEENAKLLRSQEIEAIEKAYRVIESDEQSQLSSLESQESTIEKSWREIQDRLQIASDQVLRQEAALRLICQLEQQAWNIQQEIYSLDESKNPYESLSEEAQKQIDTWRRERRRLSYRAKSLRIELSYLAYWRQGFSNQGLKSYILDNVIPFLNERAQEYVDVLSGGTIDISFSTQTQLKDGSWREKFQVCAMNSQGADVYHGNSDGERRRIDLAVGWALADLAATRAEKPIHFRGLDEPFEHLDATGEDLVIKLLHKVLPQYETVICVTHSTHLRDQFPEEVVVVFENGFSRISQES